MKLVGLDIGGTKIDAIFYANGKIVNAKKIYTPRNRQKFLDELYKLIEAVSAGDSFSGIGAGSAGGIDIKRGRILIGPNTRFLDNLDIVKILRKQFKKPVKLDNDTHCFLLGEANFGQGQGKKNLVGLTLGTGVGGAVMIDGKILHGSHTSAFELGHMVIQSPDLTLEDLVSSHGFRRFSRWGALETQTRAEAGEKDAKKAYQETGKYLGIGLANLINIFEPEIIIIGGGISRAGNLLLDPAKQEMKKHTFKSLKKLPPVRISRLEHAGALGATTLFFEK